MPQICARATNEMDEKQPSVYDVVESNRREWDVVYRMIASRDKTALRNFVASLRDVLERTYADEYASQAHDEQRAAKDYFFDVLAARDDYLGNRYLTAAMFVGALNEHEVVRYLCPAPPDPDSNEPHDQARVERAAWVRFTQRYAEPKYALLLDSAKSLGEFTNELVADYWALVAADPETRVGRTRDARAHTFDTVECDDSTKRRRLHMHTTTLAPSK